MCRFVRAIVIYRVRRALFAIFNLYIYLLHDCTNECIGYNLQHKLPLTQTAAGVCSMCRGDEKRHSVPIEKYDYCISNAVSMSILCVSALLLSDSVWVRVCVFARNAVQSMEMSIQMQNESYAARHTSCQQPRQWCCLCKQNVNELLLRPSCSMRSLSIVWHVNRSWQTYDIDAENSRCVFVCWDAQRSIWSQYVSLSYNGMAESS